jgi:hypothetical protein
MASPAPLAQQRGARPDSEACICGTTRGAIRGDWLRELAGRGFEAPETLLTQPISDCLHQQRPAEPGRQLGAIEATPTSL